MAASLRSSRYRPKSNPNRIGAFVETRPTRSVDNKPDNSTDQQHIACDRRCDPFARSSKSCLVTVTAILSNRLICSAQGVTQPIVADGA